MCASRHEDCNEKHQSQALGGAPTRLNSDWTLESSSSEGEVAGRLAGLRTTNLERPNKTSLPNHRMHTSVPSWGTIRKRTDSTVLATTRQRIQRQLAAVIQLLEHNVDYLESFERSWIEHVISEAGSVSGDAQDSESFFSGRTVKTSPTVDSLREEMSTFGLRPRSPARVVAEDDISLLLATSKSLNSANSLLSCCYERWSWLQSSRPKRDSLYVDGNDDLQELLGRRRQRQRRSNNFLSQSPEVAQLPRRNDTTSSGSSRVATTSNDGSDNSLSLMVDDTVERWRQNAEDALNEATARLGAGVVSPHHSPTQKHSQDTYICRACTKEHGNTSFVSEIDARAVHTCTARRTSTQRLSMLSSRSPTQRSVHGVADRAGATGAGIESNSEENSLAPQQVERDAAVQPAFRSTLCNSFDKETINAVPHITNDVGLHSAPMSRPMHLSSFHHSGMAPRSQTSSNVSQTTLVSNNLRPDSSPRPRLSTAAIYGLPTTLSTVPAQSRGPEEQQTHRSRGRRWLEQRSERRAATT